MSNKIPWKENWTVEKKLEKGGQGTTFLVYNENKNIHGVLKKLRNQKSDQARRRMYKEVTNLIVLFNAGCKVPEVLETNTDKFGEKNVDLYFIMEYIEGKNLAEIVKSQNELNLNKASDIMFDLISSTEKALNEGIIHRDLKPENIIIRDFEKSDIVIVDYGISFNSQDEEEVTQAGEMLDNKFLSLPERRVPGGDRRDPRSDLTGLCAIFYYLLFEEPPVDLVDGRGLLPHKRPGRNLKDKIEGDIRLSNLEAFFDKGFASDIDTRFQSIGELKDRLKETIEPVALREAEDPFEFAIEARKRYLKQNRPTQLAIFKENAKKIIEDINNIYKKYQTNKLKPFLLSTGGFSGPISHLEGENLKLIWSFDVNLEHNPQKITIAYTIQAKGLECGVFRFMYKQGEKGKENVLLKKWECVLRYDGMIIPNTEIIENDFRACLTEAMKIIDKEV